MHVCKLMAFTKMSNVWSIVTTMARNFTYRIVYISLALPINAELVVQSSKNGSTNNGMHSKACNDVHPAFVGKFGRVYSIFSSS